MKLKQDIPAMRVRLKKGAIVAVAPARYLPGCWNVWLPDQPETLTVGVPGEWLEAYGR